jgi:site-specific DNA-cytosine methylase
MADEPQLHDLTKLLLTRLESNPEEFSRESHLKAYKWHKAVETVREHGAKADKETLNAALHKFQMDEAHVDALKLLMNGDGDGVALRSTKHPTGYAAGLSGHTPGNAGNGGPGGMNVNIGPYSPRNLTPEEALAIIQASPQPLSVPTTNALTSFGQIKKRLGL